MKKILLAMILLLVPFNVIKAAELKMNKLTIEGEEISLKDGVYNYDVTLKSQFNTASIVVSVDEGVTYSIEGNENLVVGNNLVKIKLSENTGSKEYTINILKLSEDVIQLSNNNKLKNLSVVGYPIGFDTDKLDYKLTIKAEAKLKISYETENEDAEVYVEGNEGLIDGSVIKIKVIAQSGDIREYKINITATEVREPIEVIDNDKLDMNLVYFGIAALAVTIFLIVINFKGKKA